MNKIFVDTNVLISAIVFDRKELEALIKSVSKGISLIISEHILEEATRVFLKKFPEHVSLLKEFIENTGFEIIEKCEYEYTIAHHLSIRDKYDAHVIACAESVHCDVILSGDKDVLSYEHETIDILNASGFLLLL